MTRLRRHLVVRLAIGAALLFGGCTTLVPIDVTGEWTGTFVWTSGPQAGSGIESPISIMLVHEGRDVTGTVTLMGPGSQPFDLSITSGQAASRSIDIQAAGTLDAGGSTVEISMRLEGDYDESAMSGTGSQTFSGTTYDFAWELVRISGPPEP